MRYLGLFHNLRISMNKAQRDITYLIKIMNLTFLPHCTLLSPVSQLTS